MYQDAGVVVEKLVNKDENQCPAAAKPGLHFNSLILENLLRVHKKRKMSCLHPNWPDCWIRGIINWYRTKLTDKEYVTYFHHMFKSVARIEGQP